MKKCHPERVQRVEGSHAKDGDSSTALGMTKLASLSTVIDKYDALILDLWGVVHDGTHLYDGVKEALEQLKAANKKVIFLSNAPRRAHKVKAVLSHLGVGEELYLEAISSGEAGYRWLASELSSPCKGEDQGGGQSKRQDDPHPSLPPIRGKEWRHYYYIGPDKDADVLDGLPLNKTDSLADADFLLNVGFGSEEESTEDCAPILEAAKNKNIPMLCLNPDLEVVKITGERFACAGVIAKAYEAIGGTVQWFGKPYTDVYEACFALFGAIDKSRILAIGDSLETDIPGAQAAGVDSVLVTGGILKEHADTKIGEMCDALGLQPTYTMSGMVW